MSLGKQIADRRNKQRRMIETPEHWGGDGAPLIVYSSKITAGDIDKIQRKHKDFLNNPTVDGMIDLLILKAEDADGNRIFTLEDKVYLKGEDLEDISDVASKMLGEIVDVEQAEKN